jgi:Domain of unknown function (DUF4956)
MLGDVLLRLAVDAAALAALAYGLYFRRHGRRELFVVYATFNVGLFLALVVIAAGDIGAGVAFGLFALLSIVRVRGEDFTHTELAYFFAALVLALVNGMDLGSLPFALVLNAVTLAALAVIDHPRLLAGSERVEVALELVFGDRTALERHLEERLNADLMAVRVREVDYVREITRVEVVYAERAATPLEEEWHVGPRAA